MYERAVTFGNRSHETYIHEYTKHLDAYPMETLLNNKLLEIL